MPGGQVSWRLEAASRSAGASPYRERLSRSLADRALTGRGCGSHSRGATSWGFRAEPRSDLDQVHRPWLGGDGEEAALGREGQPAGARAAEVERAFQGELADSEARRDLGEFQDRLVGACIDEVSYRRRIPLLERHGLALLGGRH